MRSQKHATSAVPLRNWRHRRQSATKALAGFTDLQEIGRGGCSVVYRASEVDTERTVALKVIDVEGVSPHALESFQREALALAALGDHPNIVTLYRSLVLDDERPALVLELCTGSLAQRVRTEGPLDPTEVAAIGVKLAGALETAHRAGLLHLDVKPANILVTGYGEPALADFGLSRLRSANAGTEVVGLTTVHAAPEMLEGQVPTPAADVYQLASTLYHLLAGHAAFRAFEGEHPAAVALRVLHDPAEPVVRPEVPRSLSDLVLWALTKNPADRPGSMALFANALHAVEVDCGWPLTASVVPGGHAPRTIRGSSPTFRATWAPGVPSIFGNEGDASSLPVGVAGRPTASEPATATTAPPAPPEAGDRPEAAAADIAPPTPPAPPAPRAPRATPDTPPARTPVDALPFVAPPVPPVTTAPQIPPPLPLPSTPTRLSESAEAKPANPYGPLGDIMSLPADAAWSDAEDTVLHGHRRRATGLDAIAPDEHARTWLRRRGRRDNS